MGDEFLDDDILSEAIASDIAEKIQQDAAEPDDTSAVDEDASEANAAGTDRSDADDADTHKPFFATLKGACLIAGIILVLLLGVFLFLYLHSSSYYLLRASMADNKQDYESAVVFYEKAQKKDGSNTKAVIGAACDYLNLGQYDDAILAYNLALTLDADDTDAYIGLIRCYSITDDYELLEQLKADAPQSLSSVFAEYMVAKPEITSDDSFYDSAVNSYSDDVRITILSPDGAKIYYTLDGSEPDETKGILYQEPIILTEGSTTVKAVCINSIGERSAVVESHYNVSYSKPDSIYITPESGQYTEATYISIYVPNGAHVYYTWDGTNPSVSSQEYTEPILMIEGNNILSVIMVNSQGLSSDVFRYNYSYVPNDN